MNGHGFAALLLVFGMFVTLAVAETDPGTGVEGVIVVSPAGPGPAMADAPDSAPLANVDLEIKKGNEIVASTKTDNQGRFRISLAPGHYTVSLRNAKHTKGRFGPFEVDVIAGQFTQVRWTCESGLR